MNRFELVGADLVLLEPIRLGRSFPILLSRSVPVKPVRAAEKPRRWREKNVGKFNEFDSVDLTPISTKSHNQCQTTDLD
ncbi:hypothetical protein ACFX13_021703 [Malus domestica]